MISCARPELSDQSISTTGQVQAACDTAKRTTARLVGVEPPRHKDNEASFDDLHARIQKTSAYVESHPVDAFLGASERTIEMKGWLRDGKPYRAQISTALRLTELLFPHDDCLRHPASQRRRARQA
jgi:hypothetical protein